MSEIMANINVVVEKDTKDIANSILKDLGLNMSTYINMALKQLIKNDGIPFKVSNKTNNNVKLLKAINEANKISAHPENYKAYYNIDEMFEDILNEED